MALITPSPQLIVGRRGFRKPSRPVLDPYDSINKGLVGCWLLGDIGGTGAITRDISGLNNNGTLNGAPGLAASHHGGRALSFNGTSGFVSVANTKALSYPAITVVCWVNFSALTNAYSAVFSRNQASTAFYQLLVKSTGKLAVFCRGSTASVSYDGTGSHTLSTGVWYCLSFVYGPNNFSGLVNGEGDANVTAKGALLFPNAITTIGEDSAAAGRFVNGRIDGVRQYNRILSQTELRRLYVEPYAGVLETAPRSRAAPLQAPVSGGSSYAFVNT